VENILKSATYCSAVAAVLMSLTARAEAPYTQLRVFAPGGIAIDWEHPSDGATGITVERENPATSWAFVDLVSSFNDLGLSPSTNYRYRVCAIYAEPDCTPWLAAQTQAAAAAPANPGAPVFTSSSASANHTITVNWSSSSSYSFHNIRWAADGHADGQQEVKGRSFTTGVLRPGGYHFIVQGCNTTLLGSSCGKWSAPVFVSTRAPMPPPPPPVAVLAKGVIYGVTLNDDLMWHRHDGRTDGSFRWAAGEGKKIGQGWQFKQLFANAGFVYGIKDSGELMWYQHLGREDGTFRWKDGKQVGTGWASFTNVFSGGDGIIYAIEPMSAPGLDAGTGRVKKPSGGRLMWYRHVGQKDGSFRWEGPKVVGTGWAALRQAFYGGNGVVYFVQENGELMWARHIGRDDGTFRWDGPKKVGSGWGGFTKLFSGGDGVIYAVQENGDLVWYRHDGHNDGSFRWAAAAAKKVGSGWYKFTFKQVFTD
jgi:hypothetical protein